MEPSHKICTDSITRPLRNTMPLEAAAGAAALGLFSLLVSQ